MVSKLGENAECQILNDLRNNVNLSNRHYLLDVQPTFLDLEFSLPTCKAAVTRISADPFDYKLINEKLVLTIIIGR